MQKNLLFNMKLKITYSLGKELKEAAHVLLLLNEYKGLRSFILPTPKSIFLFANSNKEAIKHTENVWSKYKSDVENAFKKLGIKVGGKRKTKRVTYRKNKRSKTKRRRNKK